LVVDNQIQVDYITPHLEEMVSFIRKEVKNYLIQVIIQLNDQPEVEVKFLTGKDKFAALARKNPNLHTLKNTFNLDIEF
jgi:DNA-binding protein